MKTYKGNPFDKPEEKKQCDIHVVVKSFYCDDAIERLRKCKNQCKFCETLSSE
jgi:hypothetical protein